MAGGTYNDYNKTLPGVYIRYKTKPDLSAKVGERGIVAIAKQLHFGKENDFIVIEDLTKLNSLVGFDITSDDALFIRELTRGTDLTGGASKILLWKLKEDGNAAASVTIGNLTATAVHKGLYGNNIMIVINPDAASKYEDAEDGNKEKYGIYTVETYYNNSIVDTQTIGTDKDNPAKVEDLSDNTFVKFTGKGELEASVGTALTGGLDGALATTAHSEFLSALAKKSFTAVIYDGTDTVTKSVYASFVKRMSEEEGKYCVAIMADYVSPNNEYCISIKNGYILETGEKITPEKATWWLGGAEAGANYNESLTYHNQPAATSLLEEYENTEIKELIAKGHIVLMNMDGEIKIVTDINTFTSFTPTKSRAISKNRVMRTIFQVCNDLYANISKSYIGKVDVNADGVNMVKGFTIGYLDGLQANRAIKNFTKDDVTVEEFEVDSMKMGLYLQPVDSLEKLYVEILIG